MAPDALTFLTPPTTTTPVLTGDSFVIRQNNPKRPGTASYLRVATKCASPRPPRPMFACSVVLPPIYSGIARRAISLFVIPSARWKRATLLVLMTDDGDSGGLNLTTDLA